MQFANLDLVAFEPSEGFSRFLEFNRQVTRIIIDPQAPRQSGVVRVLGAKALEKRHCLGGRFQIAKRLWFQAEMQSSPGLFFQARDMLDAAENVRANPPKLIVRRDEFLERTGHGAHAPFDSRRHELPQQIEQPIRIIDAVVGCPIRAIDLLLDALPVKLAVGKPVDRKNVTIISIQPAAKIQQGGRMAQLPRGRAAETQPDGIRLSGANAVTHGEGEFLQRRQGFRPRFSAMDVRAIGQMQIMVEFHRMLNLPDCPRNLSGF